MARSISPASRTSTGLNSTPNDGAAAWIRAELAAPGGYGRIPKDRRSRHAGRDLFEQLQPFPADAVFEIRETGGVAARPRQAIDKAGADRIGGLRNTIGTVRVACCNGRHGRAASGQDDVRRERDQFGRVFANVVGFARGPAVVDPHVAAVGPAQLLQPLQECRDAGLSFRIVRGRLRARRCAAPALAAARAPRAATPPPRRRAA